MPLQRNFLLIAIITCLSNLHLAVSTPSESTRSLPVTDSNGKKNHDILYGYEQEMEKYFHVEKPKHLSMPSKGKGYVKGKGYAPVYYKGKGKGKGYYSDSSSGKKDKSYYKYWAPSEGGNGPQDGTTPTIAPSLSKLPTKDIVPPPSQTGSNQQGNPPVKPAFKKEVTSYALTYTFDETPEVPSDEDLIELEQATEKFMEDFFKENFGDGTSSSLFLFDRSETARMGGTDTTSIFATDVYFLAGSSEPRQGDLENAVEFAFTNPDDLDVYLTAVKALPETNEYRDVTNIAFHWAPVDTEASPTESPTPKPVLQTKEIGEGAEIGTIVPEVQEEGRSSASPGALSGAVGAAVFALLVGGLVLRRRQRDGDEDEAMGKFINDVDGDGHVTLAETFAGETHGSSVGGDEHNQKPQQQGAHYRTAAHSSDSTSPKPTVGSSYWGSFQKTFDESNEQGISPEEWDEMQEALSAGRPPSPNGMASSLVDGVAEEDHDDEFSYSEDSASTEPGPMQDVRL